MGKRVILHKDGKIYTLELCSPPGNVTDQLFFKELAEIVLFLKKSDECEGLTVHGRGRHFSSGADIEELKKRYGDGSGDLEELRSRSLSTFEELSKLPFPVVAAIQGCCLGSGLELALACHFRVASANSLFSMPETGYGLMPGCGGTSRLPGIVGFGKSIEIILSGRNYLAEEALQMNLIDCIVEKKKLMDAAREIIRKKR